jgi:hypothetical protein
MRKYLFLVLIFFSILFVMGCKNKKNSSAQLVDNFAPAESDSTMYGVCGEGTAMHTLELITDGGDTLEMSISDEGPDSTEVEGGLLNGDRMAVTAYERNKEYVAQTVINLTTLIGHWTSIDKNFEIAEGGTVKSYVKAEQHPWTSWKILNGKLLLNRDTFKIDELGADSIYLENTKGIFAYKRLK